MSAIQVFFLVTCLAVLGVQCRVIKLEEIPIKEEMTLKISIKKDNEGNPVASIKLIEKPQAPMDLIDKFVKSTFKSIPSLNDRSFISGTSCPLGKVRKGFACI
ncbi:unnamed protein product [Colias eurytheme]|nr:unnamed protein product [Colias eurytheme]